MTLTTANQQYTKNALSDNSPLQELLEAGIEDMKTGREYLIEDAFLKIDELRNKRRIARL